jgi:hypothetical protein
MTETKNLIHDAKHWRDRAEEARAVSEQMTDAETQRMMRGVADCYERLAKSAERATHDLGVNVDGDTITVQAHGTAFSVAYRKNPNGHDLELVHSWVPLTVTSPAISNFRNLALQVATEKARELGWIA